MKKMYKDMLLRSLAEDIDSWKCERRSGYDCSWDEWSSKEYISKDGTRIMFCVGNLSFGTCAFINGIIRYKFSYVPIFSSIAKAIRQMKKYIREKNKIAREKYLMDTISKF